MPLEVKELPVERIIVKNRYRKDLGELDSLVRSIRQVGVLQPITVDPHRRLIAGERRLRAAIEAGLHTIPCIIHNSSDRLDAMEIELMENICRKDMHWSEIAKLENDIFEKRKGEDPSWTTAKHANLRGISVGTVSHRINIAEAIKNIPELSKLESEHEARKEVQKLIEGAARQIAERKRPPHVVKAIERASEHYIVGNAIDAMEDLTANSFDFAEVDPPYGVRLDSHRNKPEQSRSMETYQEVDAKAYPAMLRCMVEGVFNALKNDTYAIFWYGFEWHCHLYKALTDTGFRVNPTPAVWIKNLPGAASQPDITLASGYEQFLVARKGLPKLAKPGRGNVFRYDVIPAAQKIHPTQKPTDLMQDIIETFCFEGSNILCPFLGSGVTLRAAYSRGHTGMGWDLSQEHKDLFLQQVEHDYVQLKRGNDVGDT